MLKELIENQFVGFSEYLKAQDIEFLKKFEDDSDDKTQCLNELLELREWHLYLICESSTPVPDELEKPFNEHMVYIKYLTRRILSLSNKLDNENHD